MKLNYMNSKCEKCYYSGVHFCLLLEKCVLNNRFKDVMQKNLDKNKKNFKKVVYINQK